MIYDKGCLRAGEEWVERNLIPVAGVAVAMAVLQVLTLFGIDTVLSLVCTHSPYLSLFCFVLGLVFCFSFARFISFFTFCTCLDWRPEWRH